MNTIDKINSVAHVIQLAVAPVFLLTGVSSLIGVLIGRLVRAIDRFRFLRLALSEDKGLPETEKTANHLEMSTLSQRARFIQAAISLSVICALLICIVIATLFIGSIYDFDVSIVIAVLFVAAMLALIVGLLAFLREIFLATGFLPRHRLTASSTPEKKKKN